MALSLQQLLQIMENGTPAQQDQVTNSLVAMWKQQNPNGDLGKNYGNLKSQFYYGLKAALGDSRFNSFAQIPYVQEALKQAQNVNDVGSLPGANNPVGQTDSGNNPSLNGLPPQTIDATSIVDNAGQRSLTPQGAPAPQVNADGTITLVSPFGESVNLPQSEYQRALNSHYTLPGGGASSGNTAADAVQKVLETNPPKVENGSITPKAEDVSAYLEQAKASLDPYYHQLISQAQSDLTRGFTAIGQDLTANERTLGQNYGVNLQNTQESLARRGLTDSTIRSTAERTLAQNTQAAIDAGRLEAQRRAQDIGTKGERYLGSSNLPSIPNFSYAPTPVYNQPGGYGFTTGTKTRSLYTPTGDTVGQVATDQYTAEQASARNLLSDAQTLQAFNTR